MASSTAPEAVGSGGTASVIPSTYPPPRVAWFTMAMLGSVTIFGQMDRAIFYLLVSSIKRDLEFTDTQMSVLMGMAYSLAYFLCGLPVARLTDVWRRKIILPSALAVWSLGTLVCGLAGNYWQLFVGRSLVGSGESAKGPCSVSFISDLFERKRLARAFAVYQFTIRLGESIAAILGGLLIGYFTLRGAIHIPLLGEMQPWQMVLLCFACPGLFFALSFVLIVKEPKRQARTREGSVPIPEVVHFLFKSKARSVLIPILLAAAIGMMESVGVGSWMPVFYERTYGWTPDQFAPITGTAMLFVAPGALVAGAFVSERLLARGYHDANMRLALCCHLLVLPLAAMGPLMPNFWLAVSCNLAAQACTIAAAPAILAAMQLVTPNELRGQVNALYMLTVSVLGQGLGPTVVALITDFVFQDEADLRYAMVTAVLVAVPITIALYWRTLKPYARAYRSAEEIE